MYNASLKYKWDNQNVRDYAAEEGREKGLKEGREEGREEGKYQKAVEMAIKLKAKGTLIDEIVELTDLSVVEIQAL